MYQHNNPSQAIVESLIFRQLGEPGAPYRRLNRSEIARQSGTVYSYVGLVIQSLLDHGEIQSSPHRPLWFRNIRPAPLPKDLPPNTLALEARIAAVEARIAGLLAPSGHPNATL